MTTPSFAGMRAWLNASLANRITAVTTAISAAVVIVVAGASFTVIQHLLGQRDTDAVRYLTINAQQHFERRLSLLIEHARQLSESSFVRNALTDTHGRSLYLEPMFDEAIDADPAVLAIALNDHNGARITSIGTWPGPDAAPNPLLREVAEQGLPRVTASGALGEHRFEVGFPVLYPPTGTIEGALSVSIDVDRVFAETFGALPAEFESRLHVVTDTPSAAASAGVSSGNRLEFLLRLSGAGAHLPELQAFGARVVATRVGTYTQIAWLGGSLLLLSLIIILAVRAASVMATARLLEPIRELRDAAARIASGGIAEASLLPTTHNDEIGVLTAGFNAMIRRVRAAQNDLEMRVRLRTVELARTQRNLARILDSMQEVVYSASLNQDFTHYVSPAYSTLSGQDTDPVTSALRRLRDAVHPDDRLIVENLAAHLRDHTTGDARYRIVRPDGSEAWLHERVRRLRGSRDEPEQLFGVINDITKAVAEESYREHSEARLLLKDRALHAATNGICILEVRPDGSIMLESANPAFERICHADRHDISADPLRFLDHATADGDRSAAVLEAIRHGKPAQALLCLRCSDGIVAWIEASIAPLRDHTPAAGFHVVCVFNDVTQRRSQEEWLRIQNRAIESSANGMVISDMCADGEPILYANPAFERITGYSRSEVIGRNCRFLQGPETSSRDLRTIRNAIGRQSACTVEIRNYRKDGSAFWNELSLSPVRAPDSTQVTHYIGILNDITDRRETEDKLVAAFSRLDALFTLSPDGFASFDAAGVLTFVNPAFERMFGLPAGDAAGLTSQALDERLRACCDPATPFPLTDLNDPEPATLHVQRPTVRILKRTVRTSHSDEARALVYFRDVTHETEVDRLKSEFLSTAAHELRTPLASIMGFSELLLTRDYPPERVKDLLSTINRQSHQLTGLLNELLDLARIEARQGKDFVFTHIDLNEVVRNTTAAFFPPGGRAPATLRLAATPCMVMVDPSKTQQALTNLLSNAFKYSPDGGEVEVEVCAATTDAPNVCVRITDHGMGMTPQDAAQAFDRFFRADKSGRIPGTGLGLALVKEIIELQNGRIELDSEAGRGTTIRIWLPSAPLAAHSPEDPPPA